MFKVVPTSFLLSDAGEILQRSRSEWLNLNDILQILLVDLPILDEPVTDFAHKLFRFMRTSVIDDHKWSLVLTRKTREEPPLMYDFSRINLGSLGADLRDIFERQLYKPNPLNVYGHYVFAHYIRYDHKVAVDDDSPSKEEEGSVNQEEDPVNEDHSLELTILM
ncbi:hypothetical protein N665_0876s0006 [Sinapis alba]|nr:hypothetical protein N665_0876s0006 [Sinapis alba]